MFKELIEALSNLFAWIVIVAPWEQVVRVRMGKRVKLLGAGMYLRIPFIDRVYRQSTRRRLCTVRPQVLTSKDHKTITISSVVGYRVDDALKLYDSVHDAEGTIESEIEGEIANYISTHNQGECGVNEIKAHVLASVDLSIYGLADQEFFVSNISAVKAYRFITGGVASWSHGEVLNTRKVDQA